MSLSAAHKGLQAYQKQPTPNLFVLMSNQNIETTEKENTGNINTKTKTEDPGLLQFALVHF